MTDSELRDMATAANIGGKQDSRDRVERSGRDRDTNAWRRRRLNRPETRRNPGRLGIHADLVHPSDIAMP
jgi:hypothetical protein